MSKKVIIPPPATETCSHKCACGKTHVVVGIEHYGRYILSCGARVWALAPGRNAAGGYGSLVLKPWPGPALTAREFAERKKQLDGGGHQSAATQKL
jgi:hypothetical protein